MASQAKLGSFDDLMRGLTQSAAACVEPIARRLREVILEDFPGATEIVRLGDRAASYGLGPKKMSESHVYLMPQSEYVNLGFYHGAELADPTGLLEGTGTKLRHVKVRCITEAESPAIRALVAAALAERRSALGLDLGHRGA